MSAPTTAQPFNHNPQSVENEEPRLPGSGVDHGLGFRRLAEILGGKYDDPERRGRPDIPRQDWLSEELMPSEPLFEKTRETNWSVSWNLTNRVEDLDCVAALDTWFHCRRK